MKNLQLFIALIFLTSSSYCSISEKTIENSLSGLISPSLCQLKLICAISQSDNVELKDSVFMRGITVLSDLTRGTFIGNTSDALLLQYSLETGISGRSCQDVAPECPYSDQELLQAVEDVGITKDNKEVKRRWKRQANNWRNYQTSYDQNYYSDPYAQYSDYYNQQYSNYDHYENNHSDNYQNRLRRPRPNNNRRQSVLSQMPPIFRPRDAGAREVCRTCDVRGNVCSVYGIGTFVGCTGVLLIGGVPAQFACNMITTPGSIGCGLNTMHCFMESCGLVRMTLPGK